MYNSSAAHPSISNLTQFALWYEDDPFNIPIQLNLTISNNGTCNSLVYEYNNQNFYPIDGMGFGDFYNLTGTGGGPHNYGFTFNFHARFTYQGNEGFSFAGDDDVFVFINDLLALDLGGVHSTQNAAFDLTFPSGGTSIGNKTFYKVKFYVLVNIPRLPITSSFSSVHQL